VAFLAANAGDEAHTTGIVLIARVIETLRIRCGGTTIRCIHGNLLNEFFRTECIAGRKDTAAVQLPGGNCPMSFIKEVRRSRQGHAWAMLKSLIYRKNRLPAELPCGPSPAGTTGTAANSLFCCAYRDFLKRHSGAETALQSSTKAQGPTGQWGAPTGKASAPPAMNPRRSPAPALHPAAYG
jgi:hypothetical protein